MANRNRPTVLFLSRQAMANQANSNADHVAKGGYILEDSNGTPDLILIGTGTCLLYTSPSPRDRQKSRMPSSA